MLRWPDSRTAIAYLWVAFELALAFAFLYGGTNWLAEQRSFSAKLWMAWELAIPLLPYMILPYFSIHLLTAVPLFTMDEGQIRALGRGFILATFLASIVFLLLPAHIGFRRNTADLGFWQPFFEGLYFLDKSANTFPSLHITYTVLVVRGVSFHLRNLLLSLSLVGWALLIAASVLFTHQHHVIDIFGGLALAEFCFWSVCVKDPFEAKALKRAKSAFFPAELESGRD